MTLEEQYFKRFASGSIIVLLIVLSYLMVRSILLSIFGGFLLAFIFSPVYKFIFKKTKHAGISAGLICLIILLITVVPLLLFSQNIINESISIYQSAQKLDLVTPLKKIFPTIFSSEEFSYSISASVQEVMVKFTQSLKNSVSNIFYEFPTIILHLFVVFFILFYALKDKDQILNSIKEFLPFSKDVEKKLFDSTKEITSSILYGQVVIGIVQGLILAVGLLILQVPNAFVWIIIGIIAGIFPIIGPSIVGVPTALFFVLNENYVSAVLMLLFTALSSFSDQLLRPLVVARKTKLHPALALIGMVGGYLFFGMLGFIIGPLIIAYLLITLEVYRNKESGLLIKEEA